MGMMTSVTSPTVRILGFLAPLEIAWGGERRKGGGEKGIGGEGERREKKRKGGERREKKRRRREGERRERACKPDNLTVLGSRYVARLVALLHREDSLRGTTWRATARQGQCDILL